MSIQRADSATSAPQWSRPRERVLGGYSVEGPDGRPAELRHHLVAGDRLTSQQLEEMSAILQRAFHGWPDFEIPVSPAEHLRWKVEGPGRWVNSARFTEGPAGMIGLGVDVGREVRIRGLDALARVGADSSVDPVWQGRGVAYGRRELNRHYERERFAMTFGTTAHPRGVLHRPDNRELGNPIQVLVLALHPWRLAATWRRATGRGLPRALVAVALGGAGLVALSARLRRHRVPAGVSLREAERFDERADELFDLAATPFDFIVTRRHDYLNWRYADRRAGTYRIVLAEQGTTLVGYAVTRVDGDRGYLVDLLAPPGRDDVLDALLGDAVARMRAAGVSGVMCWLIAHHPFRRQLRRYGFVNSRRNPNFTHHATGVSEAEIAFLQQSRARIHLMHGDSDVI